MTSIDEVQNSYRPLFIDLERKTVFTAAEGVSTKVHSLLQCTAREYYHMAGSTRYQADQRRRKKENQIESIESEMPSHKTTFYQSYTVYVHFYGSNIEKFQFFLY
ncbi:uncharacterized protein RHIMIDRAFT_259498 [Rhizopus microsporus ATCC 52813]|uniref:Uncharacterized protein n=1 Tax=Rhizopus microsporus ATCC 52813 TaxID=1340429 RepID=A0A2G4SPJ4_RHIZD|nr:uncharacterized protein RHIMIDRAFT_259498 [Rhizopus microsporus ATCC 52813]PHZ10662.1 hypothetical protein RHIMIDRAFT_259498 [Rhizopus microsporus ATCC 52813]